MLYINTVMGILPVNIQIITVILPVIIIIYISQFNIHNWNAADLNFPMMYHKMVYTVYYNSANPIVIS